MITAPELEIAVLVLGMVILMVEAFATKIDKRILAFAAIAGLAVVLLGTFFVAPSPSPNSVSTAASNPCSRGLAAFARRAAGVGPSLASASRPASRSSWRQSVW